MISQRSLWRGTSSLQYYLIPADADLPEGDFIICTPDGSEERAVDADAVAVYAASEEEVLAHLQADLDQVREQVSDTLSTWMGMTAAEAQKQDAVVQDREPSPLIMDLLGFTPEDIGDRPDMVKDRLVEIFDKLGDVALNAIADDPAQQAEARAQMQVLQRKLERHGIDVDPEVLAQVPDRVREAYYAPERAAQRQELALALDELAVQLEQTAQTISQDLQAEAATIINEQHTTEDTDTMNEEAQETSNGQQAFETLGQFLEEDGWHPQQLEDRTIYGMGFAGDNGRVTCYAQVRVELEQFVFYVMAPAKTPEEKRQAMAEFITRANYGLRIGNFEMDFNDGEVRYKSSLDFEDVPLQPELIRNAIYPAVQTMDRYLPGIMGIIYGDKAPEAAIAEIEDQ